jgi:glyoxylase-like metal-dependent hydrolase (beta-lactamase superfamily II)
MSLLFGAAAAVGAPIALSEDVEIQPVESGVFIVVHRFGGACNSLLVQCAPREFVWVDTPCTDDATSQVHQWLKRTFTDPNIIQINTGFHNDNLGGNGYLIAQGIPCYGSDLTPRLIAERWEHTRQMVLPYYAQAGEKVREIFLGQRLVPPNKLYPLAQGLTLRAGDESVEVFFPGPSHTADNVVVYFKNKRILFGGCMVKTLAARTPGFVVDADMAAWPISVQKVLDRFPDAQRVVPGHGAAGDLALLPHTIRLCEQYNRQ